MVLQSNACYALGFWCPAFRPSIPPSACLLFRREVHFLRLFSEDDWATAPSWLQATDGRISRLYFFISSFILSFPPSNFIYLNLNIPFHLIPSFLTMSLFPSFRGRFFFIVICPLLFTSLPASGLRPLSSFIIFFLSLSLARGHFASNPIFFVR